MNNNKPKWIKYTLTILLWSEGPEKTKHGQSLKRRNPKCKTKKSPNKQTNKKELCFLCDKGTRAKSKVKIHK